MSKIWRTSWNPGAQYQPQGLITLGMASSNCVHTKQQLSYRLFPEQSWRRLRTVFIYEKDDPNLAKNWRPIGINSYIYRIMICAITKSFIESKREDQLCNSTQKGFIPGQEGCLNMHAHSTSWSNTQRESGQISTWWLSILQMHSVQSHIRWFW